MPSLMHEGHCNFAGEQHPGVSQILDSGHAIFIAESEMKEMDIHFHDTKLPVNRHYLITFCFVFILFTISTFHLNL